MWGTAKLASLFILLGLSLVSGIVSVLTVKCLASKYGKSKKFARTISVLNCFAGGVFFSTCILDILPEGREKMEEAKGYWGWDTEYPLSELLVGIGFLLVLTMEHGVHTCFHFHAKSKMSDKTSQSSASIESTPRESYKKVNEKSKDSFTNNNETIFVTDLNEKSYYDGVNHTKYGAMDVSSDKTTSTPCSFCPNPTNKKDVEIMVENNNEEVVIKQGEEEVSTAVALKALDESSDEPHRANVGGIVLLAALSFHMVFDGLSLGLLQDSSKIWNLLLALCLHKALVFFTIGLQALEILKSVPKTILVVCFLSLVSPLGIVIAASLSNTKESVQVSATAIIQGLAAGTFIYVTFFEILQREFSKRGHDLALVLVTILGFALPSFLPLLEHDED